MKKWLLIGLLAVGFTRSSAQHINLSDYGCGTVTTPQEMQQVKNYLNSPLLAKTTAGVDSIPLSIHIVGKDDGTGYYKLDNLFSVLCQLNTHYAPVDFYFYIKWPVHYINNTSFYIHDFWGGDQMMNQNNIPNTVNVYFVEDPSGACGYFAPSADGIAINKSCGGVNSTTLTHEIGHYFGLPHTFSGWEGGATPSNPERVTRGSGANCSTSGDFFCDTDADYLSNRWNCPYTGSKLDQTGTPYHPDSSLYMGYASDACMTRFSTQQIGMMQYTLNVNRTYLLQNPSVAYSLDTPAIIYPVDSMYANDKIIRWHKVPGADYYQVKFGFQTLVVQEGLTADTFIQINPSLYPGSTYTVSVYPMNTVNLCKVNFAKQDFIYSSSTPALGIDNIDLDGNVSVFPNPANETVSLSFKDMTGQYQVQLMSLSGQKLFESVQAQNDQETLAIPVRDYPNGFYILRVISDNNSWTKKLVIQH